MAESTLRRIQPLIFDENIADNFVNFEREWKVYQIAALSEKDKKVQAYTLLNLAGPDAILKSESFEFGNNESKEDPDVLIAKFREQCMPTRNIIIDRHNFNTCNQKQSEAFSSYLATIKILAKKCEFGTLNRGRASRWPGGPRLPKRPSGQPKPYFGWPCWPTIIL